MNIDQARNNLMSLLSHADLKLCWQDHCALRESVGLLYSEAKEKQEDRKPEPETEVEPCPK